MLAQQPLEREDAGTTVSTSPRRPAHLGQRPRTVVDGAADRVVVDDLAMADDHGVLHIPGPGPSWVTDKASLT
jgi:hypothetical protein